MNFCLHLIIKQSIVQHGRTFPFLTAQYFYVVGFHLSGSVLPYNHGMVSATSDMEQVQSHKPAVVFDRGHVTSCTCTCNPSAAWCCHIVALCLHRIYQSHSVVLRPPVSESLSRLQRNQLQKFSQYLISELPQQVRAWLTKIFEISLKLPIYIVLTIQFPKDCQPA